MASVPVPQTNSADDKLPLSPVAFPFFTPPPSLSRITSHGIAVPERPRKRFQAFKVTGIIDFKKLFKCLVPDVTQWNADNVVNAFWTCESPPPTPQPFCFTCPHILHLPLNSLAGAFILYILPCSPSPVLSFAS